MIKVKKNIFTRKPYRGIITEIAREQHVTRAAIHHALFRDCNERILSIAIDKIEQRKNIIKEFNKAIKIN